MPVVCGFLKVSPGPTFCISVVVGCRSRLNNLFLGLREKSLASFFLFCVNIYATFSVGPLCYAGILEVAPPGVYCVL